MCDSDRRMMTSEEGDALVLFTTMALCVLTVILSLSTAS